LKLTIAYLSPSYIPSRSANSVHVMKMCEALAELGNNVILLAKYGNIEKLNDYAYYGVTNNFKIIKNRVGTVKIISELYHAVVNIYKCIKIKPDLIYSRHYSSIYLASFLNIPFIHEDHSIPTPLHRFILKYIFRKKLKKIVLISEALKKDYQVIFPHIKPDYFIVAHDAAEDPVDLKCNYLSLNTLNRVNVGYIGHLYPGKGMEIITKLAHKMDDITFHVIGGLDSDIMHWKNKYNLKNLIFHGYFPKCKIPSIIQNFDIMIAPFQEKIILAGGKIDIGRWTSPLKIFEYMAARKPIIASNIPTVAEVLTSNDNAILVPPNDLNLWQYSIRLLANNKSLRDKLTTNAYNLFKLKYTWSKRAELIMKSIEK